MNTHSLTFRELRCTPVSVPLATPVRKASGRVTHAPLSLMDLVTEEGIEGRSYLFTYTPLVLKPMMELLSNLAQLLAGMSLAPFDVERSLDGRFRLLGNTGLVQTTAWSMTCWPPVLWFCGGFGGCFAPAGRRTVG